MKKIVLGLFVSLFAGSIFAQSLKLEIDGKDVNGKHTTVYQLLDEEHFSIKVYLNLKNVTNAPVTIEGVKTNVVIPQGAYATWCGWGGCFEGNIPASPLAANETTNSNAENVFYTEYAPNVDQDSAVVKYKISVIGSETDFVETTITFIVGTPPVSIEKDSKKPVSIKVYPNPATSSTQFNFTLPSSSPAKLVFRNINGSIVKTEDITGLDSKNISLSSLSTGLYFYSIEQNNATISVGKLIVK